MLIYLNTTHNLPWQDVCYAHIISGGGKYWNTSLHNWYIVSPFPSFQPTHISTHHYVERTNLKADLQNSPQQRPFFPSHQGIPCYLGSTWLNSLNLVGWQSGYCPWSVETSSWIPFYVLRLSTLIFSSFLSFSALLFLFSNSFLEFTHPINSVFIPAPSFVMHCGLSHCIIFC